MAKNEGAAKAKRRWGEWARGVDRTGDGAGPVPSPPRRRARRVEIQGCLLFRLVYLSKTIE